MSREPQCRFVSLRLEDEAHRNKADISLMEW